MSPKRPADERFQRDGSADKRRRLSTSPFEEPSDSALLYYNARAAHFASYTLLQQAFLPAEVSTQQTGDVDPIIDYTTGRPLMRDPGAAQKALALQVHALDCLRIGLKSGMLSIGERAAFTAEFAVIGIKVLDSDPPFKLEGKERLQNDVTAAVSDFLAAELNPQMAEWKRYMEWISVKLAFVMGRHSAAKRLTKQYARTAESYYPLSFLQLQYSMNADNLPLVSEMLLRAQAEKDIHMIQLLSFIHLRILFCLRRHDVIPSALESLAASLGWHESSFSADGPSSGVASARHAYFVLHYMILRALWEGRVGNDAAAKAILKRVYLTVDEALDSDLFTAIKQNGGVIDAGTHGLQVQTTHANNLFLVTFLATVTSRRDYIGHATSCKGLVYAKALNEFAGVAKVDDMWDTGFHPLHGLGRVEDLRSDVYAIQAEMLLEEATALMYRSAFAEAEQALDRATRLIQVHDFVHLHPHVCVLQGQLAQLLGFAPQATRYYHASLKLTTPGSELSFMVQASIWGTEGKYEGVLNDHAQASHVRRLGDSCKKSSSAMLQIVGGILHTLTDENRTLAKRKITATYDLCQSSNNNLLRALVFAFTSSTLLTGSEDRVGKQIETGLEISSLLGGKDRDDKVGQAALGLWFAYKLRSYHNRRRELVQLTMARSLMQRHFFRLTEVIDYGTKKYGEPLQGMLSNLHGAAKISISD